MDNIVYIEVLNKICTVHTEKNNFQTYISLDALSELLDSTSFIRAQRSFIVNMKYIESFYFDPAGPPEWSCPRRCRPPGRR